jgi:preprotein translocase subunit SecD
MLERDRALEQRDVAEKQAISARMEAESAQEDVEDMRERCDAELAKMGARLEAAVADRDGVQRVLERMSAEQGASLQVRQALKEEIQDALEQSNVVEEECEQLRMRVRELEVEVERERLGRARMAQELARAQAAAQQGIALKKQLAASVLHALDLSATSQPLWGGSEEDDKGLKVGCPQNNEVSNSPSRQERRSSPHQYRGQTEEGKVGVVGEGNDEGDEKTSKPAASMFGKYQPRKLMRLRRDSIAPESEGSVKTL